MESHQSKVGLFQIPKLENNIDIFINLGVAKLREFRLGFDSTVGLFFIIHSVIFFNIPYDNIVKKTRGQNIRKNKYS